MENKNKTVEGYPVEIGKFYQTREGKKAYVYFIEHDFTGHYPILAVVEHQETGQQITEDGYIRRDK